MPVPTTYPDTAIFRLFEVMGAISLAVSLGLFWYARRSRRDPRFLLNLGLVYEVLIALSVGLLDWAYNLPVGLSWMGIIILIFAAIIPAPPAKTLAVALLAASMDPVGALIWKAAGQQHVPGAGQVFLHAFPNYLCALIAPLISHIITGLGREVRKAREMGSYVLDEPDRRGRDGRGVAGQPPVPGAAGGDQADQARGAGRHDAGAAGRPGRSGSGARPRRRRCSARPTPSTSTTSGSPATAPSTT